MIDLQQKINSAIDKGITFLSENQFENGEFRCYMSNNEDMLQYNGENSGWFAEDGVVFPTILIGNSLIFLSDESRVNQILNKITHFLLSQRRTGSAWNHFTPLHYLYKLCPFDLDDTACASAFLKARNVDFPPNTDLIIKNVNKRKLFYTWITLRPELNLNRSYWRLSLRELKRPIKSLFFWKEMECSRDDIDAVVNANVLYYLSENTHTKPVIDYLINIIINEGESDCDKWYRNVYTIYYFISRNYYAGVTSLEPIRQLIIDRIIKQFDVDGKIGDSPLDTALAVCALSNLNYTNVNLSDSISYLIKNQSENGNWKKRAYYYGGPKKLSNWGSEELTTAICLEALGRYIKFIYMKKILKLLAEVKLTRTLSLIWSLSPGTTALTLLMILIENGLFLLLAYTFKDLVNIMAHTANYDDAKIVLIEKYLLVWFIIIILYVVVKSLSQFISQIQASKVGEFIDDKIHESAIELDLAFYESPEYFDTLKRARDAGPERPNAVVTTMVDVAKNVVMFCILAAVVMSINWLLLPILTICIVPSFLVRVSLADKLYQLRQAHTPTERKTSYLSSLITGDFLAKEIRSFGLGSYLKEKYLTIRFDLLAQRLKIMRRGAINEMITSILASAGFFACIAFICFSAMKGKISLGDISIFIIVFPQLFSLLQSLSQSLTALYQNGIFMSHLFQFFDQKALLTESVNPIEMINDHKLDLKVENVNFTYPNSSNAVLKNINLHIPPGKVIAIVGLNGAGKTTLIKLLCRLYDPTSGSIKIGNNDIRHFKTDDFRKSVSVVFQDFGRYNVSVTDNIRFGDINSVRPQEDIAKAAEASGANEYIEKFPNGYDTIMGRIFEDGQEVSIGQWQKLAIARALYSPSKFIILDEATSALDALAEYEFFKTFRKSIGNKGAVLISHRVSAVKHADYIYVMANGEVAQSGTHQELIAMDGNYATLFKDNDDDKGSELQSSN